MAKAIDNGLPKMRIEEAAARRQAHIDSGKEKIVGLNYLTLDHEDAIDILEVDNSAVRQAQIARLEKLRSMRSQEKVDQCLNAITKSMETGEGNLLELAVEAARARASLGEISMAIEKVSGRHKAVIHSISGVYSGEFSDSAEIEEVRKMTDEFEKREGRRPRIMVAKMGRRPRPAAPRCLHRLRRYGLRRGHRSPFPDPGGGSAGGCGQRRAHRGHVLPGPPANKTLLPALVEELKKRGREDIMVIAGGVIPPQDYAFLYEHGATCIFGPGSIIPECAKEMLIALNKRLGYTD